MKLEKLKYLKPWGLFGVLLLIAGSFVAGWVVNEVQPEDIEIVITEDLETIKIYINGEPIIYYKEMNGE